LDIGVLGYISIVQHKEHSPEVLSIPPGTPCILYTNHLYWRLIILLCFLCGMYNFITQIKIFSLGQKMVRCLRLGLSRVFCTFVIVLILFYIILNMPSFMSCSVVRASTRFSCSGHHGVKCQADIRDPVTTYRVNSTVIRDSIFVEIGLIRMTTTGKQRVYSSPTKVTSTLIRQSSGCANPSEPAV